MTMFDLDDGTALRSAPPAPALQLTDVRHRYGQTAAVDGVTVAVAPGEVVCLLGPSGCGKTTVLRLAAGLETLREGVIQLSGATVAGPGIDVPPERRGVGLVFQDYALFPHLDVLDNVAFGLTGWSAADRRARAEAVLALVGMNDHAEAFPHELSGGQQQRVALARALAPRPRVVLLDEPYSGLDARLRDRVRDEVLHILKASGSACLMVTHDSEEAMFMADRIAVMRAGRIVQQGTPVELYCEPVDAFVASFFGEVNQIEGVVHAGSVETPIGSIPARGLIEGTPATVVVRPEAVTIQPWSAMYSEDPSGIVEQARLLGRTSLVHLSVTSPAQPDRAVHLHARVPGVHLPKPGARVRIQIDPAQTFVFPDRDTI